MRLLRQNPDYRKAQGRSRSARRYAAKPEVKARKAAQHRDWHSLRRYGLTYDQKMEMLEAQGGCKACGAQTPGTRRGWHVDHNHATGAIRGILCHHCNVVLGQVNDSAERLLMLVEYLRLGLATPNLLT